EVGSDDTSLSGSESELLLHPARAVATASAKERKGMELNGSLIVTPPLHQCDQATSHTETTTR
ncbi:MAG TPA: hypothetical protein DD979_14665, partial [Gammaproteobacteria bacterium]|nr:hypothetical protein [Gammaproteobacteria bacterium]